jgi:hypothetical protein
VEPASTEDTTGLRRSTRLRKEPERYMNGYLATVVDTCQNDGYECFMAYKAELQTKNDTGLVMQLRKRKTMMQIVPTCFKP